MYSYKKCSITIPSKLITNINTHFLIFLLPSKRFLGKIDQIADMLSKYWHNISVHFHKKKYNCYLFHANCTKIISYIHCRCTI